LIVNLVIRKFSGKEINLVASQNQALRANNGNI
jgi:hypothetical protein